MRSNVSQTHKPEKHLDVKVEPLVYHPRTQKYTKGENGKDSFLCVRVLTV
jgi:hypothetical protein